MSQQYGIQGHPMTVPAVPTQPPADHLPDAARVDVTPPLAAGTSGPTGEASPQPGLPASSPRPGQSGAPEGAPEATVRRVALDRLIEQWERAAETTALRSDYQRGQRDATLACIADLRAAAGR